MNKFVLMLKFNKGSLEFYFNYCRDVLFVTCFVYVLFTGL